MTFGIKKTNNICIKKYHKMYIFKFCLRKFNVLRNIKKIYFFRFRQRGFRGRPVVDRT